MLIATGWAQSFDVNRTASLRISGGSRGGGTRRRRRSRSCCGCGGTGSRRRRRCRSGCGICGCLLMMVLGLSGGVCGLGALRLILRRSCRGALRLRRHGVVLRRGGGRGLRLGHRRQRQGQRKRCSGQEGSNFLKCHSCSPVLEFPNGMPWRLFFSNREMPLRLFVMSKKRAR